MKKLATIFSVIAVLSISSLALAQVGGPSVNGSLSTPPPCVGDACNVNSVTGIQGWILGVVKLLTWLFWIIAVLMIFYAAYLYLTSAGDEDKNKKAKQQFLYAIIAIAIALVATAVPSIVQSVFRIR